MLNQEAIRLEREAARERVKCLEPLAQQCRAYEQQVAHINESLCGGEQVAGSDTEQKLTQVMQEFFRASAIEPTSRIVELFQPVSRW
ncbi:MAG: hypothetical protein ING36_00750 [Burkholderiales bacterium]|jgi:hypothetical protein|nr:hypothetical protein [Burkholderiales bacterium]MCA3174059.1 hypothetical protein [Burkholderiales bacterium]